MKEEHVATKKATRDSLKDVALRNLDMIVAAAAVVVLGLHLAGFLFSPRSDAEETREALEVARGDLSRNLDTQKFPIAKEKEHIATVEGRMRSGWAPKVPAVPPLPTNATYPPALLRAIRDGDSNEIRFYPPAELRAEAQKGTNVLRWIEHEANNTRISGFAIFRGVGKADAAKLSELDRIQGDKDVFQDRTAKPGVVYTYRVRALTDELKSRGVTESDMSTPVTVETLADFKLTLKDVNETTKVARFLVEKWHEDDWWGKEFECSIGQTIGALDSGTDVDYTTPRTLKTLDMKPVEVTRNRREVVFDASGRVKLESGEPVTEEVPVREKFLEVKAKVEGGELPPKTYSLEKR